MSENEHTFYKKVSGEGKILLLCLYVDDIIYMSSSHELIEGFRADMMQPFAMTDCGLLSYLLGLKVKQMFDGVFITQSRYVKDLVKHL